VSNVTSSPRPVEALTPTWPVSASTPKAFVSVAEFLSAMLFNPRYYVYNTASQRTRQNRTDGSYVDYTYDGMGQLLSAEGKEPDGTTNRLHEQLSYVYDAAGNLNWRTNNALAQSFGVNLANELTTASRTAGSTLTVAGTTTGPATNVTVNTYNAELYGDATFAKDGLSLTDGTNTFTAVAKDSYGRQDTNTASVYLPASANCQYDANGNLLSDGQRHIEQDGKQLARVVTVSTQHWRQFASLMRAAIHGVSSASMTIQQRL
jgi:uncharacterized lipoprotein YmbA